MALRADFEAKLDAVVEDRQLEINYALEYRQRVLEKLMRSLLTDPDDIAVLDTIQAVFDDTRTRPTRS